MKKVIGGKEYDTETADALGRDWHLSPNDFSHYDETLFRTENGRFFLSGGGGPMSRWACSDGRSGTYGSKGIIALSTADALEWCERHYVSVDVIAENFDIEEA